MSVKLVPGCGFPEEVRKLFTEYTEMLVKHDPGFKEYLAIQNYDEELQYLEKKYGMPEGRLYLAYDEGKLAGCVGLKKIDAENCEMKRLYVRPQFRGKGTAGILIRQIIEDAGKAGYHHMLLDTLPFLQDALHLYQRYGFYEIESYNNSPMDTSIYMKLDL